MQNLCRNQIHTVIVVGVVPLVIDPPLMMGRMGRSVGGRRHYY
jgi:hypothetical protein